MQQTANAAAGTITLWIIEDNEAYRKTTSMLIGQSGDIACTRAFSSCEAALEALKKEAAPDVFLVDVALPGMTGIEGISRIRAVAPQAQCVVLTVFDDDDKIFRAICAGASGYLLKTAGIEEIAAAIREVNQGGAPMSSRIARRVLEIFNRFAPKENSYALSPKEKLILELSAKDFSKKQIADKLNLSFHTVDTHLRHIYKKLHVHSSAGAVAKALKERLF